MREELNLLNVHATHSLSELNNLTNDPLLAKGWVKQSLGQYRSNGQIKDREGFSIYSRIRNLQTLIGDDYSKKTSNDETEKQHKTEVSPTLSNFTMGSPELDLTDDEEYSSFLDLESLREIRENKPCLLIGVDSEWQNIKAGGDVVGRDMLSWQFAFIDKGNLIEFVFLKESTQNLKLCDALGYILDSIEQYEPEDTRSILRYKYCIGWKNNKPILKSAKDKNTASKEAKFFYHQDFGFTKEKIVGEINKEDKRKGFDLFEKYLDYQQKIKVCLVCHTGKVDLSTFGSEQKDLFKYLSDVQGGVVSRYPLEITSPSFINCNNKKVYHISLSIADTMCHAPAKQKKLEHLGNVIGFKKIDVDKKQKDKMEELRDEDIVKFMEYASTDSVITMLYCSKLYGYNNIPPITLTSVAAKVVKKKIMNYLECKNTEEFDYIYRGLEKVSRGKVKKGDSPVFLNNEKLIPISPEANIIQQFASDAYHGGYNACTEVGYFPFETCDYDLKNAYPTAMYLVPDINWENPIKEEIENKEMDLSMFKDENGIVNPFKMFVGYITFEFPDKVKYPCFAVNVEGSLIYPYTSDGIDGVYSSGIVIWLALTLGARITCKRGYFLNVLYKNGTSEVSRSLGFAVRQMVEDRRNAKYECGDGSLEETLLKMMVNACYGKVAQNVIEKKGWSAYSNQMESIGCSSITNPVSAMMITNIAQVELLAAQNQLRDMGYSSYSVTTDGFISNCSEEVLKNLTLYGLRQYMEEARMYLTNNEDREIWEIKHAQDDLVNFTTRGNVSLYNKKMLYKYNEEGKKGVCAHNSTKSGYPADSYEDRHWLMTNVLSRTNRVEYADDEWITFKELAQGKPYYIKKQTRRVSMDFDMKRKPIFDTIYTDIVKVDGIEYEIAHVDTKPFHDINEYKKYRAVKNNMNVLRTKEDWDKFKKKLALSDCNIKPRNLAFSALMSCIRGYYWKKWSIPALDKLKTVRDKCEYINRYNLSNKKFKDTDWYNSLRKERKNDILPQDIIAEQLKELQNGTL